MLPVFSQPEGRGFRRSGASLLGVPQPVTDPFRAALMRVSSSSSFYPDFYGIRDPLENLPAQSVNSFYIFPATVTEIENIVMNLKNSSYGLNSIPTYIFKKVIVKSSTEF